MIGLSGSYDTLTPIFAGLPSLLRKIFFLNYETINLRIKYFSFQFFFLVKTNSSLNPVVFAVAHPKYREAIAKEFPCLGIGK